MPAPDSSSVTPSQRSWLLICFAAFSLLAFALQQVHSAYSSDLGADPDEPSHAVTSLMMRDYLVQGLWHGQNPLTFAKAYYEHFPKVALGHYPPGFYLVAGSALLVWTDRSCLLVLLALLAGACGVVTAVLGLRLGLSRFASFIAGAWFVALPLTQMHTMFVMSDLQLTLGLLLSALAFDNYLKAPSARAALVFGAWAAATMLTKASGAALALVPPLVIAMRGDWRLMTNWRLWLAPVPVLLTAVPWTLATYHLTKDGMIDMPLPAYIKEAFGFYSSSMPDAVSWLVIIGTLAAAIILMNSKRRISTTAATLIALCVGTFILYLVVRSGMDRRYLLPLAPPMMLATLWAVNCVCHGRACAVGTCVVALIAHVTVTPSHSKAVSGFTEAAAWLQQNAPAGGNVLVSSDARGEGAFTAALAFAEHDRVHSKWHIVRSSKFLAASGWIGRDYKSRFTTNEALRDGLQNEHITWLLNDEAIPANYVLPHHQQLTEWLKSPAASVVSEAISIPTARAATDAKGIIKLQRITP